jgi:hypothetical protein
VLTNTAERIVGTLEQPVFIADPTTHMIESAHRLPKGMKMAVSPLAVATPGESAKDAASKRRS